MRVISLLVLAFSPCFANAGDLEISNFRSGLACISPAPGASKPGWICQPTELLLVTDHGVCTYNKEKKPCTWYGFEFDYKSNKPGTALQCTARQSEPANIGNPKEVRTIDSLEDTFEIVLPEQSGHFFNPQYSVFSLRDAKDEDLLIETTCRQDGKVAFTFRFRLHYPALESR